MFRLVEELFAAQHGQYGDRRPALDVVADLYGHAHVLCPAFASAVSAGQLDARKGAIAALSPGRAQLADGGGAAALACDVLIAGEININAN